MLPTNSAKLPPGPRLPSWVLAALMMGRGPAAVAACQRRYGSVFTLRVALLGTMVYLADPADIKTVFAGDPRVFHAGEANKILRGLLGDSSLLVIDDEVHRERRRLMLPPFHRDAVARQADLMAEIAADNIARWPVGRSFAVAPKMSEITLEVILRTVIGASDPSRLAALRTIMPRLLNLGPWQSIAIANPKLLRRRPWRNLRKQIAEADRLLYAEIADRRADPDLTQRTDTLAMLVRADCGLTDRELRDQLMTLLVAGHDTTATALSWALERLTRHPAVLARAVQAAGASAAGDPSGDEYLDAVAKETLRVRPVVFDVGRVLTEPVDLAGYRLPAGAMVVPGNGPGPRQPGGISGSEPVRPRPDARRRPESRHVASVRWRQPSLYRSHLRHGRVAGGAARNTVPGGIGHHDRRRRTPEAQTRHRHSAPRRTGQHSRSQAGRLGSS